VRRNNYFVLKTHFVSNLHGSVRRNNYFVLKTHFVFNLHGSVRRNNYFVLKTHFVSNLHGSERRNNYFVFKTHFVFNLHGSVRRNNYSNIYPTRCNFTQFILSGNCSTCFGWYLHPSSGAQTTVSTASGICHTVTVICRYRGRSVRHPQHTQTSCNSSTIAADNSYGMTNTKCCRYSCLRPWGWVEVPPETCRAVSR